jgi:hypothetical protein
METSETRQIAVWAFERHLGWKESVRAAVSPEDAVRRWWGDHNHKLERFEDILVVTEYQGGKLLGLFSLEFEAPSVRPVYKAGVPGEGQQ